MPHTTTEGNALMASSNQLRDADPALLARFVLVPVRRIRRRTVEEANT